MAVVVAFIGSQFKLQKEGHVLSDVWIEPDINHFSILDFHR